MKKYGIITAMKEEADLIIKKYNLVFLKSTWNIEFFENENIVLVLSGIWKIQAAIATTIMIHTFHPETLINIGIAGNARPNTIKIWDVISVSKCSQHDIYLPFKWAHNDYLKKPIEIPGLIYESREFDFELITDGTCITGDQFIDNASKVKMLSQIHNADCVEMEAFAFLSSARECNALDSCIVIKAISDWSDNHAITEHMSNLELAMNNSILVLDYIIKN
jgi:adenosylhomocysteine nucleosidase